jgi:hypothetical protein
MYPRYQQHQRQLLSEGRQPQAAMLYGRIKEDVQHIISTLDLHQGALDRRLGNPAAAGWNSATVKMKGSLLCRRHICQGNTQDYCGLERMPACQVICAASCVRSRLHPEAPPSTSSVAQQTMAKRLFIAPGRRHDMCTVP